MLFGTMAYLISGRRPLMGKLVAMPHTKEAARQPTDGHGSLIGGSVDVSRQLESEVLALRQALAIASGRGKRSANRRDCIASSSRMSPTRCSLRTISEAFTFVCPNCNVIFGYSPQEVADLRSDLRAAWGTAMPSAVGQRRDGRQSRVRNHSQGRGASHAAGECQASVDWQRHAALRLPRYLRAQTGRGGPPPERRAVSRHCRGPDGAHLPLPPDGTITFVNGAYARYFQAIAEELVGTRFWTLDPRRVPCGRPRVSGLDHAQPSRRDDRASGYAPDGEIRWQQWTDRGIFDAQGQVLEYQAVGRDITDRKLAEEAATAASCGNPAA